MTIELPGTLRERLAAQARAAEMGLTEGISAQDMGIEGAAPMGAIDLLVELDDRLPTGRAAAKLERYDHLLSRLGGAHHPLWTPPRGAPLGRVRVPRSRPCPGVRKRGQTRC